ncbi:MAG: hypothetical protein Ta2B_12330 [Termitinemataceae bacterium]|nr:MAG: hypothetical protein Ta2B_12330 [Termitinemataceae bacterium]
MASSNVGRSIVLLLLIIMISAGGLVWFDYLGVIDVKTLLAPIYNKIGLGGRSQPKAEQGEMLNLDAERLAVRMEALALQQMEMDKAAAEIEGRKDEIEQMARDLEDRQKGLEDQENALNSLAGEAAVRDRNIEQNARNLNGMPPASAVAMLEAMDDQSAISIMRKVDAIAQAEGTNSIVSFWLSLMKPERAATLLSKMSETP